MKLCPKCRIAVNDLGRHLRRERCDAQHLRKGEK